MKKVFLSAIFAGLLLAGCSTDTSLVGPSQNDQSIQKSQVSQKAWIQLPTQSKLATESDYTTSEWIDGSRGGQLELEGHFGHDVEFHAKLKIPRGAFEGRVHISMTVNPDGTVDFGPSMTFNSDLRFDYTIEGLDLPDGDYVFAYIDGNGEVITVTDYQKLSVKKDKISVKKALIDHFSRYGFAT
jgi:hypothetical protein